MRSGVQLRAMSSLQALLFWAVLTVSWVGSFSRSILRAGRALCWRSISMLLCCSPALPAYRHSFTKMTRRCGRPILQWELFIVMLALTVPMLWSRLLFQFFAKPILDIDATLVAWLLGTDRIGNMVHFADGSGYMVVLAPCSSLANMSLAFLCWVSVTQWAKHRWSPMDLVWTAFACASVIAVNVTRISMMGLSRGYYEAIHSQWGDLVAGSVMLVLMVGFSVVGCRRELFSRA